MKALAKAVMRFIRDERGTETLEWGLICGLIVVGAIAAITVVGPKVAGLWNDAGDKINATKAP